MELRGLRSQIVVATKVLIYGSHLSTTFKTDISLQYTVNWKRHEPSVKQQILFTGNNLKSMRTSVEESLRRLRTDYIDILYVHWWDYTCSVEEIMNGLHQLVLEGKVLYLVRTIAALGLHDFYVESSGYI